MNTLQRTSTRAGLIAALLLGLGGPLRAGGGPPNCEPLTYGPATNLGQLRAFGVGNLGSEVTFVMTNPQVQNAIVTLFFSGAAVEIPDPPRGVVLVDTTDMGFAMLAGIGQFNGLNSAFLWRVSIPDNFFLAGTSLYWQGIMTDPAGIEDGRLTNGVEVCRCGQFADLVMRQVLAPSSLVFLGQNLQVADDVVNQGVLGSMASQVAVYLSTDPFITPGDFLLGTRVLFPLSVGFGYPVYQQYHIPADFTPGDYYVGAIADYLESEPEVSEINNVLAGPRQVTVAGKPASLAYSEPMVTYVVGQPITPNTPSVAGHVQYYTVDQKLPSGLSLDARTGVISGVPGQMMSLTSYNVSAYNLAGSASSVVQIAVDVNAER